MGDGWRGVVVVIVARVYKNNFSFRIVFVKKKKHTFRLEGAMPLSPSSFSSVLLLLLPPLVLLLLLLAGPRWLWWARGCCVVEVLVEGGCDTATQLRRSSFPCCCTGVSVEVGVGGR